MGLEEKPTDAVCPNYDEQPNEAKLIDSSISAQH